jgi:glycosyltransferase involved in cell wall biosynthesis
MTTSPNYVLITPARNESRFIEKTLQSVVGQTVKPLRWVIVSDGSTDRTDEIVGAYAAKFDWIKLVRLPQRAERNFAGKVAAFNVGSAHLAGLSYDVIGNLDADLSFESDYLGFLMCKFAENPQLGVAGTPYREEGAPVERFRSTKDVPGACQLFRRECFESIGGYQPLSSGGIDFVAVLAAQAKGWQTRRFEEKFCWHHRSVGSGNHPDTWRRLLFRGRKDYLLGSHPGFEIFRGLYQMTNRPYLVGGTLMLAGYFSAMLRGEERTMPKDLIPIRHSDQIGRLKAVLLHPLRRRSNRTPSASNAVLNRPPADPIQRLS